MSDILRKPYEISIWEDVPVYVDVWGTESKKLADLHNPIAYQYLTDSRIGIIGSDTMDTPIRATRPIFSEKINGERTLTFDIFHNYLNEDGELVENPWIPYLVNERKVKLKYDNKWYDFVIKNVQEKSDGNTFSFTCKDLAVCELSKTGFSIQLDTELYNNCGTVNELADAILEGCDWQRGADILVRQKNSEAMYSGVLKNQISTAFYTDSGNQDEKPFSQTIPAGASIYIYYSPYVNKTNDFYQFIYAPNGITLADDNATILVDNINTFDLYTKYIPEYRGEVAITAYRGDRFVKSSQQSYDTVLQMPVSVYRKQGEDTSKKYYGFTKSEYLTSDTVRNFCSNSISFTATAPWAPSINTMHVENVVYPQLTSENASEERESYILTNFQNSGGYVLNCGPTDNAAKLSSISKDEEFIFRIKYRKLNSDGVAVPVNAANNTLKATIARFKSTSGGYAKVDSEEVLKFETFYDDEATTLTENYLWSRAKALKSLSYEDLIKNKTSQKFYIAISETSPTDGDYYIEAVEFFKYVVDGDNKVVHLDSVPTSKVLTRYYYYDPELNKEATSEDEYVYDYSDYEIPHDESQNLIYTPFYNTGNARFEKRRSITASESNRFNMLQDICETFECWVKFEVAHNEDGTITHRDEKTERVTTINYAYESGERHDIYEVDETTPLSGESVRGMRLVGTPVQDKRVIFAEEITKDNHVGFKYGINLKSVERTLESDEIVSKIIVKPNSCEYADGGFCTIQKAQDNPTKENWIYDFDYYVQKGLIDAADLRNNLYLTVNGYIGLYPRIAEINKNLVAKNEELTDLGRSIDKLKADVDAYTEVVSSASDKRNETIQLIYNSTGFTLDSFTNIYTTTGREVQVCGDKIYVTNEQIKVQYIYSGGGTSKTYTITAGEFTVPKDASFILFLSNQNTENCVVYAKDAYEMLNPFNTAHQKIYSLYNEQAQLQKTEETYAPMLTQSSLSYEAAKAQEEILTAELKQMAEESDAVENEFNTRYARFISEGSWTSDDYMDHDLYYLDALSVLAESAFPKVTYNISVLELSQLEGYGLYTFDLGDKTTIEDTEFFGWTYVGNVKTPARETVIVSERTMNLDDPSANEIKVQNYKTAFEDLFQRITATVANLEFHEGEYAKAASAFTAAGTIDASILEASIANANTIFASASNQNVVMDSTGITLTNETDPTQIVKLTSAGIVLSSDGINFTTAITGGGVSAGALKSGILNTEKIQIMNGNYPTFVWEADGIRAYSYGRTDTGAIYDLNYDKRVVFNQFGLYGVNNGYTPYSVSDVEANALFALTWNGLYIKSDHDGGGHISISPKEDLVIYDSAEVMRGKFGVLTEGQYRVIPKESAYWATEEERKEQSATSEIPEELEDKEDIDGLYGLSLFNKQGEATLSTMSDGTLRLSSAISIGFGDDDNIFLGAGRYIDNTKTIYRVFSIYNNSEEQFYINSDGAVTANNATIRGAIDATCGKIGGITITEDGLSGDGFELTNTVFRMFNSEKDLLKFDANEGTLVINGTINADSGTIGGFVINTNSLTSNGFSLVAADGESSKAVLTVDNIQIGSDAAVTGCLQIGENLQLKNNTNVLELKDKNNNLVFYMSNQGVVAGPNWAITPDGQARFDNALITGVLAATKMQSTVFQTGYTQAMGGNFIFKSSAQVINTSIYDELYTDLEIGQDFYNSLPEADQYSAISYYVGIPDNASNLAAFQINTKFTENNKYYIRILKQSYEDDQSLSRVIYLGKTNDLMFSIYSDFQNSGDEINNSRFFSPHALSIKNMIIDDSHIKYEPKLILGSLENISKDPTIHGYGLWSDNVYLSGAMVIKNLENYKSAGIITNPNATIDFRNIFKSYETLKISDEELATYNGKPILFGGISFNLNTYELQFNDSSAFIVTDTGTMYTSRAIINNSMLVGATIKASEVQALKFRGIDDDAPLKIYKTSTGANQGIQFIDEIIVNDTVIENVTLGINNSSLYFTDINNPIIEISDGAAYLKARIFTCENSDKSNRIEYSNDFITFDTERNQRIGLVNSNLLFGQKVDGSWSAYITAKQQSLDVYANDIFISNHLDIRRGSTGDNWYYRA